ncbi:hypothetical protein L486_07122 [Kwoniella mangroviensis CBS 10435]|uniref:NAD(P)-binding protein n=1 Tax=Kwoniella mangroviensis CBS 10435 TaxID=1331196 RepID=A0A1B9IJH9_9TREE|nr:hypothetical protein L486_07122 [Kwoniella mangroviensis CBS 10435]
MSDLHLPWSFYREQWSPYPPAPKGDYLRDKTVVITGATSGIGLQSAKQLADASPSNLILAVRNVTAGEKVLKEIQSTHPDLQGKVIHLDLASISSVKKFRLILERNRSQCKLQMTDMKERTFQVNVFAPFLLTCLLLPLFKRSSDPKDLFVGSDAHVIAKEDIIEGALASGSVDGQAIIRTFNDREKYTTATVYIQSKLLLQMLTRSLIKPLSSLNITIINVNPGLTFTNIGSDAKFTLSLQLVYIFLWVMVNARSAKKAARNITSASAWKGGSQDYWSSCVPTPSENTWPYSYKGIRGTEIFYEEMIQEVEKISPGCTADLK